jgi:hypothetical protein
MAPGLGADEDWAMLPAASDVPLPLLLLLPVAVSEVAVVVAGA